MSRRNRRSFSEEEKAAAVAHVRRSGQSFYQAALELDLTETALRRWVQQSAIDRGEGPAGALTSAEQEELRQLRRENRQLRVEREILKKAALSSTGQRNSLIEYLCRTTEIERLSRALVQSKSNPVQVRLRAGGQIGTFRKVLA